MRKYPSMVELAARIRELPNSERLHELYGAALFADMAFYVRDFEPAPQWETVVQLSERGKQCLAGALSGGIHIGGPMAHFTLFRIFYHSDLLVDHLETDLESVLALLQELHSGRQATWPYAFGRLLYDKFNDSFSGNNTERIEADEANALLEGTPQGIFQVGTLLSGPLGFLRSAEERVLPPTLELSLWHCSDTGCRAKHDVKLEQYAGAAKSAGRAIARFLADKWGPAWEWHVPLLRLKQKEKCPSGRPFNDLPALISDCVIGDERMCLTSRALRSRHSPVIASAVRKAYNIAGSPEEAAERLSAEEQHQVLLLLPDQELVACIDELVSEKQIRIPPSELRSPRTYTFGSRSGNSSLLSSLGLRSVGHPPPIGFAGRLWNAYSVLGLLEDLDWRLRDHGGATLRHRLLDSLRLHGPEATVRELVLPFRTVMTTLSEQTNFRLYHGEDEASTVRRLLWKFGYNLPRYEEEYALLRHRISEFKQCALRLPLAPSEADRAEVRAVGVNLFVSVEHFLEDLVCYNVWMLASDHFTGTNFSYTKHRALEAVSATLGTEVLSGSERFQWSEDGRNTIGCLLAYFEAFRTWVKGRGEADKAPVRRREEDYPHFAKDPLLVFPFKHTALWADTPPETLAVYLDVLGKVCTQLSQASLMVVRNGLDHKREDEEFPDSDRLLACASRLEQVVDIADSCRLIPKLFWGIKAEEDLHAITCDTLQDYRGMAISLWDPGMAAGMGQRVFGVPYLVAPFDFVGEPNSILVFTVSPATPYQDYWEGFPRRRFVPSRSMEQSEGDAGEAEQGDELKCKYPVHPRGPEGEKTGDITVYTTSGPETLSEG